MAMANEEKRDLRERWGGKMMRPWLKGKKRRRRKKKKEEKKTRRSEFIKKRRSWGGAGKKRDEKEGEGRKKRPWWRGESGEKREPWEERAEEEERKKEEEFETKNCLFGKRTSVFPLFVFLCFPSSGPFETRRFLLGFEGRRTIGKTALQEGNKKN